MATRIRKTAPDADSTTPAAAVPAEPAAVAVPAPPSTPAPARRARAATPSATKSAAKPAARTAAARVSPAAKDGAGPRAGGPAKAATEPGRPAKAAKAPKVRRKPVRDSFTMPEADFGLIATLKARVLSARREAKKSELLRAGLHALAALSTPELVAALDQLEPVKIGRPAKG